MVLPRRDIKPVISSTEILIDIDSLLKKHHRDVDKHPEKYAATVIPELALCVLYVQTLGLDVSYNHYIGVGRLINHLLYGIPHPVHKDYIQISANTWREYFRHNTGLIDSLQNSLVDWCPGYAPGSTSLGYKLKPEHLHAIARAKRGHALKSLGEIRVPTTHDLAGIPFSIDVDSDLVERMLGELDIAATSLGNGDWNIRGSLAEEAQKLRSKYDGCTDQAGDYINQTAIALSTVYTLANNKHNEGKLPQVFKQNETGQGRWWANGFNLQNTPRLARKIALAGHYSYDIECCYQTIQAALCERAGLELPALRNYVNNKSEIRNTLANDIGVPIDVVKEAILAKSTAAGDRQQSMRALFEPQQLDALLDHELWKPLASDLNTALRHLVGNNNETDGLRVSQAISRICIEQESKILEAMISAADQPVLPVHDCLVTRVPNDVNKITDTVEELTEISIRLDTEQYSEWT